MTAKPRCEWRQNRARPQRRPCWSR